MDADSSQEKGRQKAKTGLSMIDVSPDFSANDPVVGGQGLGEG